MGSRLTSPRTASRDGARPPERKARPTVRRGDSHGNAEDAPAALRRLQDVAAGHGNVFDELMAAARVCSLGQLTEAIFEVGGQYRCNI
jgi:methylmalonyl-CoA mutase